jgi:hypothetical protein
MFAITTASPETIVGVDVAVRGDEVAIVVDVAVDEVVVEVVCVDVASVVVACDEIIVLEESLGESGVSVGEGEGLGVVSGDDSGNDSGTEFELDSGSELDSGFTVDSGVTVPDGLPEESAEELVSEPLSSACKVTEKIGVHCDTRSAMASMNAVSLCEGCFFIGRRYEFCSR